MSIEAPVRRREDWQELISECKQSELTVKAFCQKHSVSEALFYSWRKRLVAEDQRAIRVGGDERSSAKRTSLTAATTGAGQRRASGDSGGHRRRDGCGLCWGCCGNVRDSPASQCAGLSLPGGMRHAQKLRQLSVAGSKPNGTGPTGRTFVRFVEPPKGPGEDPVLGIAMGLRFGRSGWRKAPTHCHFVNQGKCASRSQRKN
jgi:hypothetical protein